MGLFQERRARRVVRGKAQRRVVPPRLRARGEGEQAECEWIGSDAREGCAGHVAASGVCGGGRSGGAGLRAGAEVEEARKVALALPAPLSANKLKWCLFIIFPGKFHFEIYNGSGMEFIVYCYFCIHILHLYFYDFASLHCT